MKQKLLLLMCMLATAFCAQAFTVTFDVKFGSFMTNRNYFTISFNNNTVRYDESTDKYIVYDVQEGRHHYDAIYYDLYNDNLEVMPLHDYDLKVNSDTIISLDFASYHKATLKAPDGYFIPSSRVYYGSNYEYDCSSDNQSSIYMPDGTYKCTAILRNAETNYTYVNTDKQTFTMEGADKDILIDLNLNNFHHVNFSLKGRNGEAMKSYEIKLKDDDGYAEDIWYYYNKVMLKNGDYSCSFEVDGYHPHIKKDFTVADKDMEISASYENYKKLTIQLTGSILSQLSYAPSFTLYTANNERTDLSTKKINDTEYSGECYLPSEVIEYRFERSEYEQPTIFAAGKIELNQDMTLPIDLSDCRLITFDVVDKEGNAISNDCKDLIIVTESGCEYKQSYSIKSFKGLYLQPGNYTASLGVNDKGSSDYTYYYQHFTVADEDQQVKLVCDESLYNKVTVNIKNIPEEIMSQIEYRTQLRLFSDNHIYADKSLYKKEIFLPNGTYEYRVERDGAIGLVPLTGTVTISKNNDRIDLDFSQYGMATVELQDTKGSPIENDGSGHKCSINKDGYMNSVEIGFQSHNAVLFAPTGTYLFSAYVHNCGFGEKSVNITTGKLTKETLTLTPRQSDKYVVYIGSNIANCKISLQGYGSITTTDDHIAYFYNVNAANILKYEASAPGYKTVKGTIEVNGSRAYNGTITSGVTMVKETEPMAIGTVQANDSFRVYPTVANDYINICTDDQDETVWTIRMISTTGTVVYTDKQILNGNKQIYVGNLPKGFYVLSLANETQRETYKIFKK